MAEKTTTDARTDLMTTLDALAGRGRIPVEDLSHRDDPRLHIRTPEGEIHITSRKPDSVRDEGSAHQRRWTFGALTLEEERDSQPDVDEPYAIVVTEDA